MRVKINGEDIDVEAPVSLQEFLQVQGYGDMMVAVAVNGDFVARGIYGDIVVQNNDEIEIVAPMQGG